MWFFHHSHLELGSANLIKSWKITRIGTFDLHWKSTTFKNIVNWAGGSFFTGKRWRGWGLEWGAGGQLRGNGLLHPGRWWGGHLLKPEARHQTNVRVTPNLSGYLQRTIAWLQTEFDFLFRKVLSLNNGRMCIYGKPFDMFPSTSLDVDQISILEAVRPHRWNEQVSTTSKSTTGYSRLVPCTTGLLGKPLVRILGVLLT